jgi:hypothetical protein
MLPRPFKNEGRNPMKPAKEILIADPLRCLAAAALFLFLVLYSAPHQVHHAFNPSDSAPCLAFSVAKSCHLQATPPIDLSVAWTTSEWIVPSFEVWISHLSPSPFSQRAPPTV